MKMDDKQLQALLMRWRNWSRSNFDELGYKSVTVEYELMKSGNISKQTGSKTIEDKECEELDKAIAVMPHKMKKIIKLKYLFHWLNKDAAKVLGMSLPSYKNQIVLCRSWLCGKLS